MREDCDRFRVIASLLPDGELTRLEAARHAEHLVRCDECRAYASELEAITARIRATPAQTPLAPIALESPTPSPPRKRGLWLAGHMATALAFMGLIASGLGDPDGRGSGQPAHEVAYLQSIDYERNLLRAVRRLAGSHGASKVF